MNKDVVIPEWIGKVNVHMPEDRGTTLELLNILAEMLGENHPEIKSDLDDGAFVAAVVDVANKLSRAMKDLELPDMGIWVGFPDTPVGKLNAALASKVWCVKRALEAEGV